MARRGISVTCHKYPRFPPLLTSGGRTNAGGTLSSTPFLCLSSSSCCCGDCLSAGGKGGNSCDVPRDGEDGEGQGGELVGGVDLGTPGVAGDLFRDPRGRPLPRGGPWATDPDWGDAGEAEVCDIDGEEDFGRFRDPRGRPRPRGCPGVGTCGLDDGAVVPCVASCDRGEADRCRLRDPRGLPLPRAAATTGGAAGAAAAASAAAEFAVPVAPVSMPLLDICLSPAAILARPQPASSRAVA